MGTETRTVGPVEGSGGPSGGRRLNLQGARPADDRIGHRRTRRLPAPRPARPNRPARHRRSQPPRTKRQQEVTPCARRGVAILMARASATPGLEPSLGEAAAAAVFLLALLDRDDRFDATAAQTRHGWRPRSTPCHPSRGRAAAVACPGRGGRCGSPPSAGKARRIDVLARAGKPGTGRQRKSAAR